RMRQLNRLEVLYTAYSGRTEENARRAKEDLFGVQNSRKAFIGGLAGLLDPALMGKKKSEEEALRRAVVGDPKLKETSAAWEKIAQAQKVIGDNALDYNLLAAGVAFNSHLFGIARTLLR